MPQQLVFQSRDFLNGASGVAITGTAFHWTEAPRSLFVLRTSGYVAPTDVVNLQFLSNIGEFAQSEWATFYTFSGNTFTTGVGNYQPLVYLNSPFQQIRATVSGAGNTRYWLAGSRASN